MAKIEYEKRPRLALWIKWRCAHWLASGWPVEIRFRIPPIPFMAWLWNWADNHVAQWTDKRMAEARAKRDEEQRHLSSQPTSHD